MIKLLKYEIMRKWKMSVGVLAGYLILYAAALIKFKADGGHSLESMGFGLVAFIILGSTLHFGAILAAINSMRLEAKNSSRDLYFSLPVSAFAKVGSKVIVSAVEVGLASFIGAFTAVKAIQHLTGVGLWNQFVNTFMAQPFFDNFVNIYAMIITYTALLLIIYLSFAIFRAFFSQVRFGGFVTIIIYVVLMYLSGKYVFPYMSFNYPLDPSIWVNLLVATGFSIALFLTTGYLFESRANFD